MKEKANIRLFILIGITLFAGLWRLLISAGHTPMSNFTPIGAMALFGGSYFISRVRAYLFPLLTLFISDVVLMQTIYAGHSKGLLYDGWYWTYAAFALVVLIGSVLIKKVSIKNVILGALLAGLTHFLIANLGVWLRGLTDVTTGLPYTRDFAGLIKCYTLAIPYFKNMLAGNLIYSAILFGGYELARLRFPVLSRPSAA
ncbi:hypothetical protein QQ020_09160 [Fulvivirgaceae bacterium BMA12]|uniref:ECF transporter S component n=1 Tax=Agaribacillus aureus TaxID=3051825 RepID=A0ABT8L3C7_9BACT|nr:hypothetical protein [Fulvivirgaceae bacterium BMA12]